LGNLVKAKLTLVFRNSLKIDGLKFDLLEENFPISHFQNPKLTTTWSSILQKGVSKTRILPHERNSPPGTYIFYKPTLPVVALYDGSAAFLAVYKAQRRRWPQQ
jgi:hypothetical protein